MGDETKPVDSSTVKFILASCQCFQFLLSVDCDMGRRKSPRLSGMFACDPGIPICLAGTSLKARWKKRTLAVI